MDSFFRWLSAAMIPLHIAATGFNVYLGEYEWALTYLVLTVMWVFNFKSTLKLVKKRKEVEQCVTEMIIKEMTNDNRS